MSLLKEEDEDLGMKIIQLEEKTNKLEGAVAEISKEARAILNDVRVVLTDLENPMNYLKSLGIDEVMLAMAENITENKLKEFMEKRLETLVRTVVEGKLKETVNAIIAEFMEKEAGGIIEGKIRDMKEKGILNVPINVDELKKALDEKLSEAINMDELKGTLKKELEDSIQKDLGQSIGKDKSALESLKGALKQEILTELSQTRFPQEGTEMAHAERISNQNRQRQPVSIVGITACAASLVRIFGRRGAERVVDDNYRLGRINEDTRSSLIRAISIMSAGEVLDMSYEKECNMEDHVLVTYLFDRLGNGGGDVDFLVVANLLGSSSIVKGKSDLKD
ncbi:MAG: hypothetical protein H5T33_02860 [Candidatus Methanosuratus sp.]|nr:hypothetical protein [Candidatus Methanosuratincola sp.]